MRIKQINIISPADKGMPGETIQGTYKGTKKECQYACILLYQGRARTLVRAHKRESAKTTFSGMS